MTSTSVAASKLTGPGVDWYGRYRLESVQIGADDAVSIADVQADEAPLRGTDCEPQGATRSKMNMPYSPCAFAMVLASSVACLIQQRELRAGALGRHGQQGLLCLDQRRRLRSEDHQTEMAAVFVGDSV